MTKRLSRSDLKRENRDQDLAIRTLGDQLVAEQRKRKAAEENVGKAVESGDKARNELADLRRQLSDAREAAQALHKAVFPWSWYKGFSGEVNKSLGTISPSAYPYTLNVTNLPGSPLARGEMKASAKDWSGLR